MKRQVSRSHPKASAGAQGTGRDGGGVVAGEAGSTRARPCRVL